MGGAHQMGRTSGSWFSLQSSRGMKKGQEKVHIWLIWCHPKYVCWHWNYFSVSKANRFISFKTFNFLYIYFIFFCSGYILELINRSAISLQDTFTATWGLTYSQNSQVFSDLYTDLRQYCRGSNVNLEEVLNEFWARLLEKLFYQANRQNVIGRFF